MEKSESSQMEQLHREPTVLPLPKVLETEAGVLLDTAGADLEGIKLAQDGHVGASSVILRTLIDCLQTVLLPQPTDLDSDPLNWSYTRKYLILYTCAFGALCADFTSASGTATIFAQAAEWHMTPDHVNYSGNLNVLMM